MGVCLHWDRWQALSSAGKKKNQTREMNYVGKK
jgi:hypothetical protein